MANLVFTLYSFPGNARSVSRFLEGRLRSFYNVISFIGRGKSEEPEYNVEKDPRTEKTTENPAFTLAIMEADWRPPMEPIAR